MIKELKKYKYLFILTFLAILFVNVPIVKADNPLRYYISNEEAQYEGEYINYYKKNAEDIALIKVKKGDIVTVTVVLESFMGRGMILRTGTSTIKWDATAFKLVSRSGDFSISSVKNISIVNEKVDDNTDNVGTYSISYEGNVGDADKGYIEYEEAIYGPNSNSSVIDDEISKLYQLKFQVLDDVKDGIYKIFTPECTYDCIENHVAYIAYSTSPDFEEANEGNTIYYQVGNATFTMPTATPKPTPTPAETVTPNNKSSDNGLGENWNIYIIAFIIGILIAIICSFIISKIKANKKIKNNIETSNNNINK